MECLFDSTITWMIVDTLAAFCLAINPHNPSEVWCSLEGGMIRVYDASDRRIVRTLVVDSSNPQGRLANIVFDPRDRGIVYASGILMQGVYRSMDGGVSWSVLRRHDSYLTNYAGECLKAIVYREGVRLVSGNFSRGELEFSDDEGASWNSATTGHTGSICSIACSEADPENVILGCKYGKLLRVHLPTRTVQLTGVLGRDGYYEVPRIIESARNPRVVFGISAGFDSASMVPGVFQSCDRGLSWTRSWLPGVNIWAVSECICGHHVVVGGFSEFSNVTGKGIVAAVNVSTDNVDFIGKTIPWYRAPSSVWDLKILRDRSPAKQKLLMATEDGVYVGYAR